MELTTADGISLINGKSKLLSLKIKPKKYFTETAKICSTIVLK